MVKNARLRPRSRATPGSPGNPLAEYTYLGLGSIVREDFVEPDVRLDYDSGTAGEYAGFDRFGRVIDQRWYDYGASADRDRYTYAYDRASNRLYRENTLASGKDEFYTYDDVDRLVNLDRGDLNANKDAISGTPAREEDFGLDATGNWTDYLQKTSGTTDLDQDRTQNKVNETTAITATTGTNWADPVYDPTGNMTTTPKPSSLANTLTCTYDAWYRLVEVKQGQTVVAKYEYDGRNRRTKKHLDSQSPGSPDGIDAYVHYFYNGEWQILETRQTTTESTEPENLQPKHQHLWSPRYVDALVLRDENTDHDGLCDDQRLYYLNDANFNVTALVDTAGDAVERYLYDAYGALSVMDGDFASRASSSYANPYTYTGREFDGETGLYHYRNRYYHAQMGAFVSRDPIGYRGEDSNMYCYAGARPLTSHDPSGLLAPTPVVGIGITVCSPMGGVAIGVPVGCVLYRCVTKPLLEPCLTRLFFKIWCDDSPLDPCKEDYIKCLHTSLADQGYGNRCGDCNDACTGLGVWKATMNGMDCAYWNYPSTLP